MSTLETRRLGPGDQTAARDLFAMMTDVFGEDSEPLGDEYLDQLLGRESFWVIAAFIGPEPVGGITAHSLPMTRSPDMELFIYDLAVRPGRQRQGIGGRLVHELRQAAAREGIHDVFVPADDIDEHAIDFYRAQGAVGSAVTIFTFAAL